MRSFRKEFYVRTGRMNGEEAKDGRELTNGQRYLQQVAGFYAFPGEALSVSYVEKGIFYVKLPERYGDKEVFRVQQAILSRYRGGIMAHPNRLMDFFIGGLKCLGNRDYR